MKQMKKLLCGVLMVCMILSGITVAPQNVQAANSDFVIKNGILKEYRGNGKNITITFINEISTEINNNKSTSLIKDRFSIQRGFITTL